MKNIILLLLVVQFACSSNDENTGPDSSENTDNPVPVQRSFNSYKTGNTVDKETNPVGGICLMGGASENDQAMKWFLERADGGDILVLRASGADGYNNYMYSELGVSVNSVETIVVKSAEASDESYIHEQIKSAEAIWFAGGDQWDYISFWRDTAIASLINDAITTRKIVIGGTSAGMAIQGAYYFTAKNGTITSTTALNDPYDKAMTIDSKSFIKNSYLSDVITDTHYDNPDRKGRHVTFLARILKDTGFRIKGIACDESTAVCIDELGLARIYGDHPSYDDNAYFIQTNPDLQNVLPENCSAGNPLDWNLNGTAIKVYKVVGTSEGTNSFNLNDWETGEGGVWENWSVNKGELSFNQL
ncbi:cyanophycinase [Aquimarina sp. 2-A2]|uniref:cyanophycinase n=1 Tax=Aquimarina sp. 2-A2 TaxID=3382644 RepID=UPI00387F2CE6